MKYLALAVLCSIAACARQNKSEAKQNTVTPVAALPSEQFDDDDTAAWTGKHVVDYANSFSESEEIRLDSTLTGIQRRLDVNIVVVAFDSGRATSANTPLRTRAFAQKFGSEITIGLSLQQHAMYIWNDSFVNKVLFPEDAAQNIVDNVFIPLFRQGKNYHGTMAGISAIAAFIEERKTPPRVEFKL